MRLRYRILLALIIGILSGTGCFIRLETWQKQAGDFTFTWRAAKHLLAEENPYKQIQPEGDYPFQTYLYYPLTAVIASLPFVPLLPHQAGAVFFGISSTILAFALTAQGWKHMPLFLSAPFFTAAATAQWSPLIVAAAMLPPLNWLLTCKPNLGLATFFYRPTWVGFTSILLFLALSIIIMPSWPADWIRITQLLEGHPPPVALLPFGPLLLLAAIAWRKREGRMFLGLSLLPQLLFFYDQLPLWLIPKTFSSSLVYSALSWTAYFTWRSKSVNPLTGDIIQQPAHYVLVLIFLPALGMLLWQERGILILWKKRCCAYFSDMLDLLTRA